MPLRLLDGLLHPRPATVHNSHRHPAMAPDDLCPPQLILLPDPESKKAYRRTPGQIVYGNWGDNGASGGVLPGDKILLHKCGPICNLIQISYL